MNFLLQIMQRTKSNLSRPPGTPYVKQIFKTDQHAKRNMFESVSFVCPSNRTMSYRSHNSDILRNSSTQTSKTMVSLNVSDSPRMSPDSLSPKTDYCNDSCQELFLNLDKPSVVDTGLSFSRKNCVLRYLHKPSSGKEKIEKVTLAENSLTKAFLEKRHLEISPRIASTRSKFLQQTSPLRNLIPHPHPHEQKQTLPNFKSQSFVENPKRSYPPIIPQSNKFKVKSVKEKPPAPDNTKPVRFFCEKNLALNLNVPKTSPRNTKNHSFMSPTFSSEQKNKMREIETVTKLISPTRRGRSASPKAHMQRESSIVKKVPYIDKSSSSIFHNCTLADQGDSNFGLELSLRSPKTVISNSTILENSIGTGTEHVLFQAITKLRDVDWNTALRGLAEIVEICRTVDTDVVYPHMTTVNQRIIELLKSPRSHVCRSTCQAVGHMLEYVKDTRRPEFDEIVDTLLCRTADSNKFIRHDANLALDCMVTHIPILHAVRAICTKGPDHKNSLVRAAAARLLVCALVIAGPGTILNPNNNDFTRRRVILNMARFLNDKNMETRKYGERLYKLLCTDRMFDMYLRRYLEKDTVQKMKACFKKYHHKNGTKQ